MLYTVHLSAFGTGNKLFKIGSSAARLLNVIMCVLAMWLSRRERGSDHSVADRQ